MAEHQVMGPVTEIPRGEMLLFGKGENGEKAILSLFLVVKDADNNPDEKTNKFMDHMNIDKWEDYPMNEMDDNDLPVLKCLKHKYDEKNKDNFNPNMKDMIASNKKLEE